MAVEIALDIRMNVETQHRDVEIAVNRQKRDISMTIEKSLSPMAEYEGPYEVSSRLYWPRKLATAYKLATKDITVNAIPVRTVTNPSGGNTVTIGEV